MNFLGNKLAVGALSILLVGMPFAGSLAGTPLEHPHVQAEREQLITIGFNSTSLEYALKSLEQVAHVRFAYKVSEVGQYSRVDVKEDARTLSATLDKLLEGTDLTFKMDGSYVYILPRGIELSHVYLQQTVQGTVLDENEAVMEGVTVRAVLSGQATTTDADGAYVLSVTMGDTVQFSFVGYEPFAITMEQLLVNGIVRLSPSADHFLDEVVVVGYGTQKLRNVVGAVDRIDVASMEGRPATNTTQLLQGVSPSLVVQLPNAEPGAAMNVNIRGISTLGNNSPLVVIDGIVGGDINLLNPADIATISVLKDAGSAAIYGSRASNGVILITTKQGSKDQRPVIAYNGIVGVNTPHMFFQPVSGYENAILRNQSAINSGLQPVYSPSDIRAFESQGDEEWFVDGILQNALQQNHNLSVSGGSAHSTYHLSAGLTDQQNNFVGPDFGLKRYNFRLNNNIEYGRLKLGVQLAYARSEVKDHSSSTSTLMVDAARVPVHYRLKDEEGRYLTNNVLTEFNPLGILENGGFRKYTDDNVLGNVSAELRITDWFKLRGVFGGSMKSNSQYARTQQVDFFPSGVYGANRNTNDIAYKSLDLNTQLMADFSKRFDVHEVNVLLGASNENFSSRLSSILRQFTDPALGTPVSETVIQTGSQNSNQTAQANSLNSLFGRASYGYLDRYTAEFNFRYDGSSKFRDGRRWGFFPSVGLSYRLSEEDFMQDYRHRVGEVKLRSSYGVVGNQNVDNFQYQTTFFTFENAYGFNNEGVGGTGFNFANPDLRWERAATFNIGGDFSFFDHKLTLSADYFNKVTRDILIPPRVPGVFGTGLPDFNAAEVQSRGWEIAASFQHVGDLFSHHVTLNVGDARNKVLHFEGNQQLVGREELQILLKEGHPYNSYVGFKRDGYFQTIDEVNQGPKPPGLTVSPGDNRYVDLNGDGVIDDNDLFIFGNPFPRLNYGAQYTLAYKGFDLFMFWQGVGNRTMMIRGELVEPFHSNYGLTMYQHQLDFWTPLNPDARYPRLAAANSSSIINNFKRGSDMFLYDASYLRLKNLQIGYTLPTSTAQQIGLQKLRVYATGQNLLTFSGLKFVDPEITEFNNSMQSSGANSGRAYPTLIYYGFGLDITF